MLICANHKHGIVAADKATCTSGLRGLHHTNLIHTWVDLLAILQDFDGQKERKHELVGLKQAAADIDEQGVGEGLIQSSTALCYTLCLQSARSSSEADYPLSLDCWCALHFLCLK